MAALELPLLEAPVSSELHNLINQLSKEEEFLERPALSPNQLGPLEQPHPPTPHSLEHNLPPPRAQVHLGASVKANPPKEESSDNNNRNSNRPPPQEYLEEPLSSSHNNKEASLGLPVHLVKDKVPKAKAKECLDRVLKDNNSHKVKEYSDNKLAAKVNMVEQPQLLPQLNPNNKLIHSEATQPAKEQGQEYLDHPLKELKALRVLAYSELPEQPTLNNHQVKEDSSEHLHHHHNQLNRPRALPSSEEQTPTLKEANHSIAQE